MVRLRTIRPSAFQKNIKRPAAAMARMRRARPRDKAAHRLLRQPVSKPRPQHPAPGAAFARRRAALAGDDEQAARAASVRLRHKAVKRRTGRALGVAVKVERRVDRRRRRDAPAAKTRPGGRRALFSLPAATRAASSTIRRPLAGPKRGFWEQAYCCAAEGSHLSGPAATAYPPQGRGRAAGSRA